MKLHIEQLWIDDDAEDFPLTREIEEKMHGVSIVRGKDCLKMTRLLDLERDPISRGKKILRLMKHKGKFVKPCPGTREYVCCGLKILHIGQGCPMDCRYCALQAYFNRPVMEIFVNVDDMMRELDQFLASYQDEFHRICTGEFTDSLALDTLTGLSTRLLPYFANSSNAVLEIKTKTDNIGPLLEMDPAKRVVLSFSVNSAEVEKCEERRADSLRRRISAASKAQDCGYSIGFHFDPIIPMSGWEESYCETIDEIFAHVEPSNVAWISMGVLRYVPILKETAEARFGTIPYFHDSFIRGLDGKNRLYVQRRIDIYRVLAQQIRMHCRNTRLYLCMESPYVWSKALDMKMEKDSDLAMYLDEAMASSRR